MTGVDRTAEFVATIKSKRDKPQWIQRQNLQREQSLKENKLAIDPKYRKFMEISKQCSHRIRDSFAKLEKFTQLARQKTVFDENELNKLIGEIRVDINESKKLLEELQPCYEPKQKHSENIVTTLQQRLVNVTSDFKSTLELRSKNVQQQSARAQELFTGPPVLPATQSTSSNYDFYNNQNGSFNFDEPTTSTRQRYPHQQQQQQQLLMHDQIDLAERADKMHLMESTIVELGTVFNQLAHMVQSQGETITRIDMNISDTAQNIESAHDALLRYFASINSNRWLMLKVFGVLFAFFIIFVVFGT